MIPIRMLAMLFGVAMVSACSASAPSSPACQLNGAYRNHQEQVGSPNLQCMPKFDTTVTFDSMDSGADVVMPGCERTGTQCNETTTCTTKSTPTTTTRSVTSRKFAADGSSGTSTTSVKVVRDADGMLVSDCEYTGTYVRQ